MNLLRVYTCSPSWTPHLPPYLYHLSGSSQCTSPKHPVSCIEPGLAICFIYDIIHVPMPFSQIIPPSPSPTKSKRLFYTSVSLLLSRIQGYCYHLSKFHIYALVYCIGVFFLAYFTLYNRLQFQDTCSQKSKDFRTGQAGIWILSAAETENFLHIQFPYFLDGDDNTYVSGLYGNWHYKIIYIHNKPM